MTLRDKLVFTTTHNTNELTISADEARKLCSVIDAAFAALEPLRVYDGLGGDLNAHNEIVRALAAVCVKPSSGS